MKKIRWGVLSTARIGTEKVIPAMQLGEYCTVTAIASRQLEKAQAAAGQLGIEKAYGSYEELLADPDNIRNKTDIGGGGLMDIGCYCISLSRFIFGAEPWRVCGIIEEDPNMKVDCLTSGILEFSGATSTFTCATQLVPYQRVNIFGTKGRIEIEIPFNAPSDRPCKVWYGDGNRIEEVVLEVCDQYTIQGDLFSQAVLEDREVPVPLEDAVANMQVIEALISSARSRSWVNLETGVTTF